MNQDLQSLLSGWDAHWRAISCRDIVCTRRYIIEDATKKRVTKRRKFKLSRSVGRGILPSKEAVTGMVMLTQPEGAGFDGRGDDESY